MNNLNSKFKKMLFIPLIPSYETEAVTPYSSQTRCGDFPMGSRRSRAGSVNSFEFGKSIVLPFRLRL